MNSAGYDAPQCSKYPVNTTPVDEASHTVSNASLSNNHPLTGLIGEVNIEGEDTRKEGRNTGTLLSYLNGTLRSRNKA